MKRKYIFSVICILFTLLLKAQTTNYGLDNPTGVGYFSSSILKELNDSPTVTIQMWYKTYENSVGACLFKQNNLSVEIGNSNTLIVKEGDKSSTFICLSQVNEWKQLSIVIDNGKVRAYINDSEVATYGDLLTTVPAQTEGSCIIGKGLKGVIDEIRIWSCALSKENLYWSNTLDKNHPDYQDLIAYWKCDQEQCPELVDYKMNYHATLTNLKKVPVNDNPKFRYRIVTGYTNLMRFLDRPNINREMFLMTNDLILLSAKIQKDGSLFPEYPDNTATPTNVLYLSEYKGRKGVMDFQGKGSQMVSEDGNAPYDPTDRFAKGPCYNATFEAWVYIDKWVEGAALLNKYQDDSNCIIVSLGGEDNKSLVINMCGTIFTINNKLEVGKWQYVGAYLSPDRLPLSDTDYNPITVSIDYQNYDRDNGGMLEGKDGEFSALPLMSSTPIVIGENFDGKLDEIMIWGSSRKNCARQDSEKEYQWNVGDWDNVFLNAYWKGDDPENIGKDSQSWLCMIDLIRSYYANHRGFKIRMGIIYPDGEGWQNGVLGDASNVENKKVTDRLIADAKKILKKCDGLDLDLEWCYTPWQYAIYNNLASRLANEVMAGHDDKTFTCSLHEVSYSIDKALFDKIDYFTFQMYGPQPVTYTWDWFANAYEKFLGYGFPNDKILLSYGVLAVNLSEEGYKDLFEKYGMNESNYTQDLTSWNCAGTERYFNSVNLVRRKAKYAIDKDVRGIMYFDMGNDLKVSDYKSLIRAQNSVVASNVDTLITQIAVNNERIIADKQSIHKFYPNPAKENVTVVLGDNDNGILSIYGLEGTLRKRRILKSRISTISIDDLAVGIYLIKIETKNTSYTSKLEIE